MILEAAFLQVKQGQEAAFEEVFSEAQHIISRVPGFIDLKLVRCIEAPSRYLLLVNWESIEDHEVGFRKSDLYPKWKGLLHHFYEPFPVAEHFETVLEKRLQ